MNEGPASFPSTIWTTILHARRTRGPASRECLNTLITLYWRPVYGLLRLEWNQQPDQAADLTQEFFLTLLEHDFLKDIDPGKGRFRSFVRAALKHFMLNWIKARRAQKRGGNVKHAAFDVADFEGRIAASPKTSPDEFFETQWRMSVLAEALRRLKSELDRQKQAKAFDVFRMYELAAPVGESPTYEDVAARVGFARAEVKQTLEKTRLLFRKCVAEILRETPTNEAEVAEEMRQLAGD